MGFFSAVKRFFTGGSAAEEKKQEQPAEEVKAEVQAEPQPEAAPGRATFWPMRRVLSLSAPPLACWSSLTETPYLRAME